MPNWLNQLISENPEPLWVILGACIVKLFDLGMALFRRKNEELVEINQAQKNLSDALFQQVASLQEDVSRLREAHGRCEEKYNELRQEIDALRAERFGGSAP